MMSDVQYLDRIKSGDKHAFAALVSIHMPRAWRIAARFLKDKEDAEEAVQDAFTKVWVKACDFDCERSSFSTWFYTILTRQCLDLLRKNKSKRHTPLSPEITENLADETPDQEAQTLRAQDNHLIREHVHALPERQKAAVILCYLEDMSQSEAAKILGLHIKALEGLLSRAKQSLKLRLGDFHAN